MVLGGQDAWRKHPLLTGCWKKPFPGLGTAVGIFSIYLLVDFTMKMGGPKEIKHDPVTVKYSVNPEGFDKVPAVHSVGSHGHHE